MERPIGLSRVAATDYQEIGKDRRSAAAGTPAERVARQSGDRVTLSPEAQRYQHVAQLTTSPLDGIEKRVSEALERGYAELFERAGKGEYLASIADTSDRSADATAGRILGGITGYIYSAFQGANPRMTAEQLDTFQSLVLKGFDQGFGEAKHLIGAAGLLDSKMTEDIDMTAKLVRSGLDDFFASEKERLFGVPHAEGAR